MLSINDLPFVFSLNHFLINKFILNLEPVTYQCLEEFYEYKLRNKPKISKQNASIILLGTTPVSLHEHPRAPEPAP